ncbi:MAG: hypothetical protein A2020_07265 [Lentisphaerae bacterium GWF2_45_14]|nr:MAG: hypothetical protein A2020_07265 [Lentisphaerae bacterium GWF2_45_14]
MFKDVTILIPVFNEERGIEEAIRSAAPQCGRLLISDNGSTDRTSEICLRLAKEYPNIQYFRQESNIGMFNNGKFLLAKLQTPYFLTMGGHDYISSSYVAILKGLLDENQDAVLAASGVKPFCRDGTVYNFPQMSSKALESSCSFERVEFIAKDGLTKTGAFLGNGLFRTDTYRKCVDEKLPVCGNDILLLAKIAEKGRILISQDVCYHCEMRPDDSQAKYFQRIMSITPDFESIRTERSKYVAYMYDIAKNAAGGNWKFLKRLFNIKMHLSVNYAPFTSNGIADFAGRTALRFLKRFYYAPGSETLLEDTLLELRRGKLLEGRKTALYGGGLHTRRLLATGIIPAAAITAIFDDSPSVESIYGIPAFSPSSAGDVDFDTLLISSDTIEERLYKKSLTWLPAHVSIIRLYPLRIRK